MVIAEGIILLVLGVPILLVGLVVVPFLGLPTGGFAVEALVAQGNLFTTVGVALIFAARGLGRGSRGSRWLVVAVQVTVLGFALLSVPWGLVNSWPVWIVGVLVASLVLYAVLLHPAVPALVDHPACGVNSEAAPAVGSSALVTVGRVMGISAIIIAVLIAVALTLVITVWLWVVTKVAHGV